MSVSRAGRDRYWCSNAGVEGRVKGAMRGQVGFGSDVYAESEQSRSSASIELSNKLAGEVVVVNDSPGKVNRSDTIETKDYPSSDPMREGQDRWPTRPSQGHKLPNMANSEASIHLNFNVSTSTSHI